MLTQDVLDHVRASAWRFSDRELSELLRIAAQEITRRDQCTGNYIARARTAWEGVMLERRRSGSSSTQ